MAGAISLRVVLNGAALQLLWFAVILGAANEWMTPAVLWFVLFAAWQLRYGGSPKRDAAVMALSVAAGSALDTLWVQLGWLSFAYAFPWTGVAPLWIAMLWAGLGLTLDHSLRWLQTRLIAAAVLAMVSAPLSYFAAWRLGAVAIHEPLVLALGLGASWALVVPGLLAYAGGARWPRIIGQAL